jgi:hypothetical protein
MIVIGRRVSSPVDTVTGMVLLGIVLLLIVSPLVVGYRKLAAAVSSQAASGVLLMMVGVGAAVWLLDNLTL